MEKVTLIFKREEDEFTVRVYRVNGVGNPNSYLLETYKKRAVGFEVVLLDAQHDWQAQVAANAHAESLLRAQATE